MNALTKDLPNFFVFKRHQCNNKKLLAWNFNIFESIHHQTLNPFKPNTPYLPHSFIKLSKFRNIGSSSWRVANILWALEIEQQCMNTWLWPPPFFVEFWNWFFGFFKFSILIIFTKNLKSRSSLKQSLTPFPLHITKLEKMCNINLFN